MDLPWDQLDSIAVVLGVLSVVALVVTAIAVPMVVAMFPSDALTRPPTPWADLGLGGRALRVVRNLLGVVLVGMGCVMLITPGQGLLTILLGLMWVDLPWRRELVLRLVRLDSVHRAVDWIRRRAGRPPLELPPTSEAG